MDGGFFGGWDDDEEEEARVDASAEDKESAARKLSGDQEHQKSMIESILCDEEEEDEDEEEEESEMNSPTPAEKSKEVELVDCAGGLQSGNGFANAKIAGFTSSAGSWLGPDPELVKAAKVHDGEDLESKEAGELRHVSILEELLGIKPAALGQKEEEPEPETPPTAMPTPNVTQKYFPDDSNRRGLTEAGDHPYNGSSSSSENGMQGVYMADGERIRATHVWGDHMRAVPMNSLGQPVWQPSQHQQIAGYHQGDPVSTTGGPHVSASGWQQRRQQPQQQQQHSQVSVVAVPMAMAPMVAPVSQPGMRPDALGVSDCATGGTLLELAGELQTPGRSREAQVWPIIRSLLGAVRTLHKYGYAHGGIGLETILRRDPSSVEVVLVGMNRVVPAGPTQMGGQPEDGKPSPYRAPETHRPGYYETCAADLFACGVVSYALATGEYPWASTRPGSCAAFLYAWKYGLAAYFDTRLVQSPGGGPPQHLMDCMSLRFRQFLVALLDFDPPARLSALNFIC